MRMDSKLQVLLSCYSELRKEIMECEKTKANTPIGCSAFIGVVLGFVFTKQLDSWQRITALVIIPYTTLMGYYLFSLEARMSAILQGYAAYIEDRINDSIQCEYLFQYSEIIDRFISPNSFITNRLSMYLFAPIMLMVDMYAFFAAYQATETCVQRLFVVLAAVICLIGLGVLAYDCGRNDVFRENARKLHSMRGNSNTVKSE